MIGLRHTTGKYLMQIRRLLVIHPADKQTNQHDQKHNASLAEAIIYQSVLDCHGDSKHEISIQCSFIAGPALWTMTQH